MTGNDDLSTSLDIEEEHNPTLVRRTYGSAQLVVDVLRLLRKHGVAVSDSLDDAAGAISASAALLQALDVEPSILPPKPVRPTLTELPIRLALARHDLAVVYRALGRVGISQRRIAAATGQSQSEISEIVAGGRQVSSYPVLARVAAGLGVPRGHIGLAFDESTLEILANASHDQH